MNETSNERAEHRTHEDHGSEDDDGHTTLTVVEHVGEDSCDDSQGTRAEEASPESTNHDGLDVFSSRAAEGKASEAKHASADWYFAALKF